MRNIRYIDINAAYEPRFDYESHIALYRRRIRRLERLCRASLFVLALCLLLLAGAQSFVSAMLGLAAGLMLRGMR